MAIAELDVVVLDCPDPAALAGFYAEVLGGKSRGGGAVSYNPRTRPPNTPVD
ncbi:VOC family protein, partial [Streptomyces scabiei]|uniref:VOC family protein n=1 Tax=Streptomyces scabiei TaxID=1930 RepID=UPI0029A2CA83